MLVILSQPQSVKHGLNLELPQKHPISGLILGLRPANKRRRYKVTPSLTGYTQT